MSKRKVTYVLDEQLVKALKIRAVREDKPDYQVLDDALRRHLYGPWSDLWERASAQEAISDEDAMAQALEELDAYRGERDAGRRDPPGRS